MKSAAQDHGSGSTIVLGTEDPTLDLALLRFIPAFLQQASPVTLCVHPRLVRLAQALDASITVAPVSRCLNVDRHIPLSTLPHLLSSDQAMQAADRLPYLHVPYNEADDYHAAIHRRAQGKPVVGLFGAAWEAITAIPGISWIGPDIAAAADGLGVRCSDYLDHAALLDCLDLVATSDLATALLAEGLGKEVWWLGEPLQVKRHLRKVDSAFPSLKVLPTTGSRGLADVKQAVRTWYNQFYDRILAGIAVPADVVP